jgi:hypothetical protein
MLAVRLGFFIFNRRWIMKFINLIGVGLVLCELAFPVKAVDTTVNAPDISLITTPLSTIVPSSSDSTKITMITIVNLLPGLEVGGRWFYEQNYHNFWTAWADQPLYVYLGKLGSFSLIELIISAKNHGKLPSSYSDFKVNVYNGSTLLGAIYIPASDTQFKEGRGTFSIPAGNVTLTLKWVNDYYSPPYDANIMIGNVRATLSY